MGRNPKISRAGWLATAVPLTALAEPGLSSAPVVVLWAIALVTSAVIAWLTGKLVAKLTEISRPGYRWGVTIIFFLVFSVFLAPIFVALGAIFFTGRTM